MTSLWLDVRYALRMIARAPAYAAIVIVTLALGIGANTTIFSWINASLLNPVPGVADPGQVVSLSLGSSGVTPFPFTYPDLEALRAGQRTFTGLTAVNIASMSLTGAGTPQRVWGALTSANYFDVLGVRPIVGRTFRPDEDATPGGAPVAVISYGLWQTRFAGRPDVVGQTMALNTHPYTIVGVTPPIFHGSQTGIRTDIYVPLMMESQLVPGGDLLHDHHYFWLFVLGRLTPGVTRQQAQEDMTRRLKAEVQSYPEEHRGHETVTAFPLWRNPFSANLIFAPVLPLLLAISGLVLLLACANVANLTLVRSVARRRELAIRASLGATRWRLVRQMLVESVALSLVGGALAVLITLETAGAMMRFIPQTDFPLYLPVHVNRTVLGVALAMSVVTGLVFGILPALRASREPPVTVLKEDAGSTSGSVRKVRLTNGLVVVQVSLSLLLLICAGLLVRSFLGAAEVDTGYNSRGVAAVSYRPVSRGVHGGARHAVRPRPAGNARGAAGRAVRHVDRPPAAQRGRRLDERQAGGLRAAAERVDGNAGGDCLAKLLPDAADAARQGPRLHPAGRHQRPARRHRQPDVCRPGPGRSRSRSAGTSFRT